MNTEKCPLSGKIIYPSKKAAGKAMAGIVRRGGLKSPTEIYQCAACHGYHLTSRTRRRRR